MQGISKMRAITGWLISFGIIELFSALFILLNLLSFSLYVIDKRKAAKNKRRISENILIFFTLAFGGIGAVLGMRLAKHKTQKLKFKVAAVLGLIIAFIPVAHIAHGLTLDKMVRYTEIEFRSENWLPELDGYQIAFLTDMHTITHEAMGDVVTELNKRNVDLLLLGGDFSMRGEHYKGTLREISQAVTTDGIFGVEGNHDDYKRLFAEMERYGITPLDNNGSRIRDGFYLAGVHDLWNRNPDIYAAAAGANANDFVLLISHNPDVSMMQSTVGVDLILSGHIHGGQITFFGIPLYLLRGSITNYGMRFANGFSGSKDGVPVFTGNGVGEYYNVPRIFARPEVVIFTMRSTR
jgi:predicted MPP superfamily phosphohydrolase